MGVVILSEQEGMLTHSLVLKVASRDPLGSLTGLQMNLYSGLRDTPTAVTANSPKSTDLKDPRILGPCKKNRFTVNCDFYKFRIV